MEIPGTELFKNKKFTERIVESIRRILTDLNKTIKIMHVCGTHEHTISKFGLRSLLPKELEAENAYEGAVFINNEQNLTNWLSVLYGVRYSGMGNIGPKTVFD